MTSTRDLVRRTDEVVNNFMEHDVVLGLVLGLVANGETAFLSYGRRAKGSSDLPGERDVFEIGSLTKTFTCALLGEAVHRRMVRLDDPVGAFLPPEVTLPDDASRITLRHLATHTSGLPNQMPLSVDQMYDSLANCGLLSEPGEGSYYSNFGMMVLGHVLERSSGKSYEQILRDWICRPLGMPSTCVVLREPDLQKRLCSGYTDEFEPAELEPETAPPGAGSIKSCAADMVRHIEANLDPDGTPIASALRETQRIHYPPANMGLSWTVLEGGSHLRHTGQTFGYRCFCDIDLKAKVGVIALCNTATALIDHLQDPIFEIMRRGHCAPVSFPIPPVASVTSAKLARLVGMYLHGCQQGLSLRISYDQATLRAQFVLVQDWEFPPVKLYPYSETDFFYRAKPRHFHFILDANGQAAKIVVEGERQDKCGTYVRSDRGQ